jgi:membrane protein implicated in regulation of membrane protease activity
MTLGVVIAVTLSVGVALAAVLAVAVVVIVKKMRNRREENQRRRSDLTTKTTTGFVVDWVEMPILRMSRPIEGTSRPWASATDLQHVYPSLEEEFMAPCPSISASESHLPCLPQTSEDVQV